MTKSKILKDTLLSLCAKGKNLGLPNKHFKKLKKKNLIEIAIRKAKQTKIDYICFSTDSVKIYKLAKKRKIKFAYNRNKLLSKSNIPKRDVWVDSIKNSEKFYKKNFKYILDIEITNPLLNIKDLNKFINQFSKIYKKYDGMFCMTSSRKSPYFNILKKKRNGYEIFVNNSKNIYSRQKAPNTYEHVAGFYYFKTKYILKNRNIFNGKTFGFKIPLIKSFDIDSDEDFNLTKLLIK
tara:strand:+ start:1015 stop:1722 length:708 start_codon:yes stop_codon:yes gene_type:complete